MHAEDGPRGVLGALVHVVDAGEVGKLEVVGFEGVAQFGQVLEPEKKFPLRKKREQSELRSHCISKPN